MNDIFNSVGYSQAVQEKESTTNENHRKENPSKEKAYNLYTLQKAIQDYRQEPKWDAH